MSGTRSQSGQRSMSNFSVRRAAASASCRCIEWFETISTSHSPLRSGNIQRPSGGTFFQTNRRSEEHTFELQSLMRTSYAVFGLNKNKHTSACNTRTNTHLVQHISTTTELHLIHSQKT